LASLINARKMQAGTAANVAGRVVSLHELSDLNPAKLRITLANATPGVTVVCQESCSGALAQIYRYITMAAPLESTPGQESFALSSFGTP
jgi:hypothetical protein